LHQTFKTNYDSEDKSVGLLGNPTK